MMRHLPATLLMTVAAFGCAPSPKTLAESHKYREALCATEWDISEPDQRALVEIYHQLLEPTVQIHAMSRAELAPEIGEDGADALLAKTALIHMKIWTKRAPVDVADVRLNVWGGSQRFDELTKRSELAAIFKERVPGPRGGSGSGPSRLEEVAADVQDTVALTARVTTFGVLRPSLSSRGGGGSRPRDPDHFDFLRVAPKTETVFWNQGRTNSCGEPGEECNDLQVVVRPKDESGPMHLEFLVRYEAFPEEPCTLCCQVSDVVEVSLPAGATIEERITRRFGDRKVALRDLLAPNRVIPRHRL